MYIEVNCEVGFDLYNVFRNFSLWSILGLLDGMPGGCVYSSSCINVLTELYLPSCI